MHAIRNEGPLDRYAAAVIQNGSSALDDASVELRADKAERVTGKRFKWRGTKRLWNGKHWSKACALAGCSTRALAHASHEGKCCRHSYAKPYACTHEGCDKRFTESSKHKRSTSPCKRFTESSKHTRSLNPSLSLSACISLVTMVVVKPHRANKS